MKYTPENYAFTISEVLGRTPEKEKSKKIKNFVQAVNKNGDMGRMGKILLALHKIAIRKAGGKWINVEFAREMEKDLREKISKNFSTKDHIEFSVNPDLKAGVRITIDGEKEFDNSLKRKLDKLFI